MDSSQIAGFGNVLQTEIVVLQPTPYCNLHCTYCYLPDLTSQRRMTPETLERIFRSLFHSAFVGDHLTVSWHGGEPLAVPRSFYESALAIIDLLNAKRVKLTHIVQTNGTLITREWAQMFAAHNIKVGVSLDGPEYVHDANRRNRRGIGSSSDALRGLRLLKEYQVEYGVLMVVTKATLDHPRGVWDFFLQEGVGYVAHNIEELEGAHQITGLEGESNRDLYARFLQQYLSIQARASTSIAFREVDRVREHLKFHPNAERISRPTDLSQS